MKDASKLLVCAAVAALLLSGCSIQSKDKGDTQGKKVDIESPLGSMHVETNQQARAQDTGLPVYPGAREAPPDTNDNTSRANLSMGFAGFGLKVVAATYVTDDPMDKVKDFYRKALAKYGNVVECNGDLDLDVGKEGKPRCKHSSSEPDRFEMGVGNKDVQHVVEIRPKGKSHQFALVYIEMRGKDRETM